MTEDMKPDQRYEALMGELRGLLSREPDLQVFNEICERLDLFARQDLMRAREHVLPYLQDALDAWPRLKRMVILSVYGEDPNYDTPFLPSQPLEGYASYFQDSVEPDKHELGVELVKGAHIVLSGGYSGCFEQFDPGQFWGSKRFLALESLVLNSVSTPHEAWGYFQAGDVKKLLRRMPHIRELHLSCGQREEPKIFDSIGSQRFIGHWEVLGFERLDDPFSLLAESAAHTNLKKLYLGVYVSLDDFKKLYHSPHLTHLTELWCYSADHEAIEAYLADLPEDAPRRAFALRRR